MASESQQPPASPSALPAITPPPPSSVQETPPTPVAKRKVISARTRLKYQLLAGLIFELAVLAPVIIFSYYPLVSEVLQARAAITTGQANVTALQSKQTRISAAQTVYQDVVSDLALIDEAMPNYSNFPYVLRILERLASEVISEDNLEILINQISIATVPNDLPPTPDTPAPTTESQVDISLGLFGSYEGIQRYIIKLRSLRHNFFLDRIIFSVADEESSFLNANITLHYIYFE